MPLPAIISTHSTNATRVFEDFRDETRRMQSDITTSWDSTQHLSTFDDTLGLQALNSRLIYPQSSFILYNPNVAEQPDYTGLVGDRQWISNFYHTNVNHSNGILRLSGYNVTEADLLAKDVEILISLNKVDWFSVNDDFLGGPLVNGSGCRVSPDVYSLDIDGRLRFTLSIAATSAASAWGIYWRIVIKESAKTRYIDSFEIIDWV